MASPRKRLTIQPAQESPLPLVEDFQGADERGEDAAAVDVAHHQHRGAGVPGHPHVDDVVALEVHFAGRAGPFQHDGVELGGQRVVARRRPRPRLRLEADVLADAHVAHRLAADEHLAAGVGVGLKQHGVHPHVGFQPAGLGLDDLGAAHLAAVAGDERVERHVLGLERRHAQAVLEEDAAERGGEDALAGVGTGALEHQGGGFSLYGGSSAASPTTRTKCRGQGVAEPLVFGRGADGHAEEPPIEALRGVEGADGDAGGQQRVRQGWGLSRFLWPGTTRSVVATKMGLSPWPVQADEEEIRLAGIDVQPRQPLQPRDQLPALVADAGDRLPGIVRFAQQGHARRLGQRADRPGRQLPADLPGDVLIRHGIAQSQPRNRVELGEGADDDDVCRDSPDSCVNRRGQSHFRADASRRAPKIGTVPAVVGQRAVAVEEIGKGLIDDK